MLVAGYLLAQGLILEGGHSIGCGPRGRYAAGCDRLLQTGPRSASLFPQKYAFNDFDVLYKQVLIRPLVFSIAYVR